VYGWCKAVSAEFAAMAASASRARCVLGERKQLASGTGVVAWCTWLAEGAEGIYPRVLCVPASPSDFHLGEVEESDEREEGDEGGSRLSASESGGVQLSVMQGCGSSWRVASATSRADGCTALLGRLSWRACARAFVR
jgi:hypothetical protein